MQLLFSADSQIYICDFYRQQACKRWLAKTSNGLVSLKQVILGKLRSFARARTEADYNERVAFLKSSSSRMEGEPKAAQLDWKYVISSIQGRRNLIFFIRLAGYQTHLLYTCVYKILSTYTVSIKITSCIDSQPCLL